MRKPLIVAALGAATLALAGLSPAGAVPSGTGPVGATAPEIGRGAARHEFAFPMEAGQAVSVRTGTVKPGEVVHFNTGSDIVIVKTGALTNYSSCGEKEDWGAGGAYFRHTMPDSGHMAKNEGDGPADVLIITSAAAMPHGGGHDHAMAQVEACPTGDLAQLTATGSGPAYSTGELAQGSGEQIAVEVFTLQPGYTSSWHQHPGANMVIQTKGTAENWQNCKDKEVWTPGNTYFHAPGHHGNHPNLTNNKTDEPTELVAIFFNVPANHPAGVTPIQQVPPPADCPTSSMTY